MLGMSVAKAKPVPTFTVSLTGYGWSVQLEGKRLDLFQTQQQALTEVKRRRADLACNGKRTTVEIVGSELDDPARNRRPFFRRR